MDANKEKVLEKQLEALGDLQVVAKWISNETHERSYEAEDVEKLSNALIDLREYINGD